MPFEESFPFYEVIGNAYELGYQHGNLASNRVVRSAQLYQKELLKRHVSEAQFHQAADCMAPLITAFNPDYFEEMRGIADGSGLSIDDVILINCRTEMLYCGSVKNLSQTVSITDGCTGLVVSPGKSLNGRLLHAHNWDWLVECGDTSIVLKLKKADGTHLLTFTEAGSLARHGFNSFGLSLSGNFLCSVHDYKTIGNAPLVLLRRKVLEAQNIPEALRLVGNCHRFCSNNLILADRSGESVCVEMCPNDYFTVKPKNGVLVHANHWLSSNGQSVAKLISGGLMQSSLGRQRTIEETLGRGHTSGMGWDLVKSAMTDTNGLPHGVLSSPNVSEFGETATVATILMEPESRLMWVQRNPYEIEDPAHATYTSYEL